MEKDREMASALAALGSEARIRIVRALLKAYPERLNVAEIQEAVRITGATLSHHLEKLREANLVDAERKGTFLMYRASGGMFARVTNFLVSESCLENKALRLSRATFEENS